MINKERVRIVAKETIAQNTIEMKLKVQEVINRVEPGQFIHIDIGGNSSYLLRRPISIADVDLLEQTITIIFKVIGSGTDQMSKYNVGDSLDILHSCGTGYPISSMQFNRALIIGGGIGVPPLYYLGKRLYERGIEVISILGYQSKANVFYESKFKQLGKCYIVTDDGSYGYKGDVTDVTAQLNLDFDYYFACGPKGMLKAVSNKFMNHDGFISIEQRMGCGIGACYACVIPINDGANGFKKICKDGPVFRTNEVIL